MLHTLVPSLLQLSLLSHGALDAAQEPEASPAVAPTSAGSPAAPVPHRFNQWSIQIAPGGNFLLANGYNAYGPAFRVGGWIHAWFGKFMVGGGPSMAYSYLFDKTGDKVHFYTVNGDFVVGGGRPDKIVGYGHIVLGGGVIAAKDGGSGAVILAPGIRAGAGGGLYGFVSRMVSLGVLVDFGWLGVLGVDAFLTVGIHFGRKAK